MKNKGVLIAGIIVIIIVVVAAVAAMGGDKKDTAKTTSSSDMSMNQSTETQSTSSDTQASNSGPVDASTLEIKDYAFTPASIKVKVGTKVTWTNQDSVKHTVTADNTSSDAPNSGLFGKGESYSFTFTKAGTYAYHCSPHPYMKGTVIVE